MPLRGLSREGRSPAIPVQHDGWTHALSQALAALRRGGYTVLLCGAAGTGKTMLLREVARTLEAEGFVVDMRLHPGVAPLQLGEDPGRPERRVVLVDEADRLSIDEIMRLLGDQAGSLVLGGVAFPDGTERVLPSDTIRLTLAPLQKNEIIAFVSAHAAVAERPSNFFTAEALESLAQISEGIPRLIVSLAGTSAWLAELNASSQVTAEHVDEAAMLRQVQGFREIMPVAAVFSRETQAGVLSSLPDKPNAVPPPVEVDLRVRPPAPIAACCAEPLTRVSSALSEENVTPVSSTVQRSRKRGVVALAAVSLVALLAVWLANSWQQEGADLADFVEWVRPRPAPSVGP